MVCHLAIWRRGWSQISLQCSPAVPAADVPSTRRPITVLGLREVPLSESIRSSSTLVSLRPSSEGRSNTKSSLKTGLGEHFFTWVFFLHMRFFPWYIFTLTYGSRWKGVKERLINCKEGRTAMENIHLWSSWLAPCCTSNKTFGQRKSSCRFSYLFLQTGIILILRC